MITKVIENFGGRLTRDGTGDMNSGLAKYSTTFGADVFSNPGNLTWNETASQIDPTGAVLTDLVMAGKERVESGVSYVYAIGHTGRLYKIQVNDPSSHNPNYDNPVLLATLAINSPTFTRGSFIDFFGTTEKIYIGHDMGLTSINFDGTGETFVGVLGSWTQLVPRPFRQFIGNLYVGNGNNLAEISSTAIVNTYTKLSPAFPNNTQVRDLDISPDGNYLHAVVTRLALSDITSTIADSASISNSDSYIFKWNGSDAGYTSFQTYSAYSLTANMIFGNHEYEFGYDIAGSAVYSASNKILSLVTSTSPMPNAIGNGANVVGWIVPETYQGTLRAGQFIYGQTDNEIKLGWWRQFAFSATGTETDIIRVPLALLVSNFNIGSSSNGFAAGIFGFGKGYFSTLETSAAPTTKYKLYKWFPISTTIGTSINGVYETQNETTVKLFRNIYKKKLKVYEVRLYTTPLVVNNSFKIDLIGVDGNPIAGGSYTFTVGTNLTAGTDFASYNPQIAPQHSIGVRITNLGTKNWVGDKMEIDIDEAGK